MTAKVEALAVLRAVAQGLAAKLYRLRRIMDGGGGGGGGGGEQQPRVPPLAVQCGLLPDAPRLLHHLARAFPDHPRDCHPEKVDRDALDHLQEAAQEYYDLLEPWYLVLWEAMRLREQAVRLLSALSSGITSASFYANPLFMRACMGLLCDFARTVVLVAKVGAPMLLQVYALLSVYVTGGNDPADYIKVVSFAQVCSAPFRTLQLDLESSGALISEALRSVVPIINATAEMAAFKDGSTLLALVTDDPATTLRLQDLAHTHDYKQWMLLGCLIRPYELLRGYKASTAAALLQENFILPVFRDEVILIHDEYAQHVLPKVAEMGKAAKAARSHSKDMEARYRQAKRSHRRIGEVYDLGLKTMAAVHYRQRTLLHHELSNLLVYFSDNLPLLPISFQIILAALSMAHEEILWYFEHAGVITARDHKTKYPILAWVSCLMWCISCTAWPLSTPRRMERATVGLLALTSKLDTMGPQVVAGEVFVTREYLRQRLMGSFHKALEAAAVIDGAVQKPSVVEAALHRHAAILSMIEETTSLQFCDAWTMDDSAAALRDRMAEWLTDQALQLAQPLRKDLVISSEASLVTELEAFVRVFGHAGLEALGLRAGALLDALLARLNTVLGRNHAALALLGDSAGPSGAEKRHLELGLALLIGLGQWLVWRDLVAVSASRTLSGCAPALHLLVQWVNRHLPAGSRPGNLYQDATGELGDAIQKLACGGAHRSWHLLPNLGGAVFALDLWADACMDGHAPALTRAMTAVLDMAPSGALAVLPLTSATAAGVSDAPSGDQTCVRIAAVLTLAHRVRSRAALERRLLFLGRLAEACPGFPHGVLERHLPLALLTSVRQQHQQRVASMTAPMAAAATAASRRAADLEAMIDGVFQAPEVDRLGRRGAHGSGVEGGNPLAHVGVLRPTKSLGSHEHARSGGYVDVGNSEGDGTGDAAGPSVLARKLLRSLSIGVAVGGGGQTRPSPTASEPGDDDVASLSPNDTPTPNSSPAGSGGDKSKQRARWPLASPLSFGRRRPPQNNGASGS
eukprot:SM000304S11841  [mRNA]  locus=s304:33164:41836:+ [translate_table: standard]